THALTDLPVLMATAKDQSADVVEALRAGANDYLTKPFDFSVVLARIQTQCALKRAVDRGKRLEQSLAQRHAELEEGNADLAAANRHMRQDLEVAARVQEALLPPPTQTVEGARFARKYAPCGQLGGDLLNVVPLRGGRVGLYLLDVSGHGVKAALLAVMV